MFITYADAIAWEHPPPAADDVLWNKALEKGDTLMQGCKSSDKEAGKLLTPPKQSAQSTFQNFPRKSTLCPWYMLFDRKRRILIIEPSWTENFETWGYRIYPLVLLSLEFDSYWGIAKALSALRASTKAAVQGGSIKAVEVLHGDRAKADEENPDDVEDQLYNVQVNEKTEEFKVYYPRSKFKNDPAEDYLDYGSLFRSWHRYEKWWCVFLSTASL